MAITPPVWFDYDPDTGVGDPSTPLSGAGLTSVMGLYNDRVEEAVDAKLDADVAAATYVTLGDIAGEFLSRTPAGPVILDHAAVPLPGSPKSGNVVVGTAYTEIQPYDESNAFPALAKATNGELVAMWRAAASHVRGFKGDLMLSRSSDLGATWSTPVVALSHATMDYRDPMLSTLSDGRLAVSFFQDDATKAAGALVAFSSDHGANWTAPIDVPYGRAYSNASSGPIVELANGDLLACGYGAIDSTKDAAQRWDVRVTKSTDGGATWGSSVTIVDGFTADRPYSETVVGLLPNGTLMALIRCDSATKTIYRSTSTDNGATWSAASAVLTNAGGRPSWVTLSSGGVVLTYRRSADNSATVVTSWDSGATWSGESLLDGVVASQSVYQQPVELSAGLVGVVYADEASSVSSRVRFRYLLDGLGFSPLGDARLSVTAAPPTAATVFVSADTLRAAGANPAPTAGTISNNKVWSFADATTQHLAGYVSNLPADWATFDVNAIWAPSTTNTGNARLDFSYLWIVAGSTASSSGTYVSASAVPASGTANLVQRTTLATGLANVAGPLSLRVLRVGADASDTFTGVVQLLGVELVKAS